MDPAEPKYCILVPAYHEEGRIGEVVKGIMAHCSNVVVVDDGSTDGTAAEAEQAGATVLKHDGNKGKGVALETGFKHATDAGYAFVITMDADGQHDPAGIPQFVEAYKKTGDKAILGNRMEHPDTMPLVRRRTNQFMSWLLSREMGQTVPDTQCGYRLYATEILPLVAADCAGFAAESEVLLKLSGAGIKIGAVPVRIIYGDEKSKINPVQDTVRFFGMIRRFRKQSGKGEKGGGMKAES